MVLRVNNAIGFGGGGGGGGTTLVVEATTSGANTTAFPSGAVAGDLILILAMERDGNSGWSISDDLAQSWTEVLEDTNSPSPIYCAWCLLDTGSSGEDITIVGTGAVDVLCLRISGFTSGSIEASSTTTGASTAPDPTSITPSWGTKPTMFVPFCGAKGNPVTGFPAGYSGTLTFASAEAIAAAWEVKTAASEDPGAFTASSDGWRAATIAIEPA